MSNLNDYMTGLTEMYTDLINNARQELLADDIIAIYKGQFRNYQDYVRKRQAIIEQNHRDKISFKEHYYMIAIPIDPYIIEEDLFNYIREKRRNE